MNKALTKFNDFFDYAPSIFDSRDLFSGLSSEFSKIINGKCDFTEEDEKYTVELEVPGVKKDEINISLKDENLTISWKRETEKNSKAKAKRYERSSGSFVRNFKVDGADAEKVDAELKNGVLKIVLPKKESAKPNLITIK